LKGQLKTAFDIKKIVLRNTGGAPIYLKDIAEIKDTTKEKESYARLDGKNVVTLNIIKRSGENLIETSEGVQKTVEENRGVIFPKQLKVDITGDLSIKTRSSFNDLVTSIIIGFILVLIILDVFMALPTPSLSRCLFVKYVLWRLCSCRRADLVVGTTIVHCPR